jgi:hypothetical protein
LKLLFIVTSTLVIAGFSDSRSWLPFRSPQTDRKLIAELLGYALRNE